MFRDEPVARIRGLECFVQLISFEEHLPPGLFLTRPMANVLLNSATFRV